MFEVRSFLGILRRKRRIFTMKVRSYASTHLLPQAPAMASQIGFWKKLVIRRAGRRSAATTPPDAEGHHPATLALAAEVARVEAEIHTALVMTVESLDRTIARSETQIRLLSARLSERSVPKVEDPAESMTATQQDAIRVQQAKAQEAAGRMSAAQHELDQIKCQVAELSERREHLHTTAAGVLASWVAWFDALTAHHRAGFIRALTRRFPAPVLSIQDPKNLPMPSYKPNHAWALGEQLPVTVTQIRPNDQPTLVWSHLGWDL